MRTRTWMIALAAALAGAAACGGGGARRSDTAAPATPAAGEASQPPAPPAPVATPPRTLEQEETITTASSTTFRVAAGWSIAERDGVTVMTGPERDLTAIYVEVEAAGGREAIAAAWKQARPDFDLAVEQADDVPGRDGWDAATQIVYVTPVAEARVVLALALARGRTWRVFLVDGKQAALGRRSAQLGNMVETLRAPGLERESWAGKQAHPLDAARLAAIDEFVGRAMAAETVPGAALAIVQDGRIVHQRGYGVRELGTKAPVGPHTRFLTGSTGKSLVTLMMARAVDRGVFGWDTPVVEVMPSFALGDPEVTRALLMRHTVCACTGMPRQDLEMIFESKGVTAEARLASMKSMVPTTRFGETFQYSNLLVAAGGYIAGHALHPRLKVGEAFDRAMQEQVFGPLGMKDTTYDFARVRKADHATPHARDLAGTMTAASIEDESWVSATRPAGGQWSSVHDYARVLLLELGNGVLDGKQVVSAANLLERRKPQIAITPELAYGMGLAVGTRHGVPFISHNGATAGFSSNYFWLPDHGVGVVVVANTGDGGAFVEAVSRRVLEALFDGAPQAEEDLRVASEQRAQALARTAAQIKPPGDLVTTLGLAGAWAAPGLGRLDLRPGKAAGTFLVDVGEWKADLAEKTAADGTRLLVTTSAPFAGFELVPTDRDGQPALVLRDQQQDHVFRKLPR